MIAELSTRLGARDERERRLEREWNGVCIDLNTQVKVLVQQLAVQHEADAEAHAERQRMGVECQPTADDVVVLQDERTAKDDECQELVSALPQEGADLQVAPQALDDTTHHVTDLQVQLDTKASEITHLEAQLRDAQAEASRLYEVAARLEAEYTALAQAKVHAEAAWTALRCEVDSAQHEIRDQHAKLARCGAALSEAEEVNRTLHVEVMHHLSMIEGQGTELGSTRRRIDELAAEVERDRCTIASLRAELAYMGEQADGINAQRDGLRENVVLRDTEIKSQAQEIASLRAEIVAQKREISSLLKAHDDVVRAKGAEIKAEKEEVCSLLARLQAEKEELRSTPRSTPGIWTSRCSRPTANAPRRRVRRCARRATTWSAPTKPSLSPSRRR